MAAGSDLVAVWEVHLADGIHVIEFEHGTTSGSRLLRVDREEVLRRDWMFKLVGTETFTVGKNKAACSIKIEPVGGFSYEYSLEVAGKPYKKFIENQNKIMKTWILPVDGTMFRVVLEKDTLDIWVNGTKVEMAGEFTDEGTETHFAIGSQPAYVRAVSSGNKRSGILHLLLRLLLLSLLLATAPPIPPHPSPSARTAPPLPPVSHSSTHPAASLTSCSDCSCPAPFFIFINKTLVLQVIFTKVKQI